MNTTPQPLDAAGIVDLASAFYGSSVLFAALDLDLFSCIHATPEATLETLAEATHCPEHSLRLLLDATVAVGLLTKQSDVYTLTPAAQMTLVKGAPHDLTRAIAYNRDVYGAWGKLTQFVKTSAPVESPALHLGDDPERTRRFAYAMHGRAMGIGTVVVPALHFPPQAKVLDLAGGPGTYALLMAQANPGLTCDTYDLPAISAVAREITAPCADRITCHAGNYHVDQYPEATYDVVTIFGALHQESPEMIIDILKRAHAALKPSGQIYVLDLMTEADHTTPVFSALFAVNMALTTEHGWVFSADELRGYLAAAGFTTAQYRPLPPPMPHWLMTANKSR